jgi:hypothetical protein
MANVVVNNVPPDKLQEVEDEMRNGGATQVTHTLQPDGNYTVTGTFPD